MTLTLSASAPLSFRPPVTPLDLHCHPVSFPSAEPTPLNPFRPKPPRTADIFDRVVAERRRRRHDLGGGGGGFFTTRGTTRRVRGAYRSDWSAIGPRSGNPLGRVEDGRSRTPRMDAYLRQMEGAQSDVLDFFIFFQE